MVHPDVLEATRGPEILKTTGFPVRLQVHWFNPQWDEWHWRTVATVHDAESLGFLECHLTPLTTRAVTV